MEKTRRVTDILMNTGLGIALIGGVIFMSASGIAYLTFGNDSNVSLIATHIAMISGFAVPVGAMLMCSALATSALIYINRN